MTKCLHCGMEEDEKMYTIYGTISKKDYLFISARDEKHALVKARERGLIEADDIHLYGGTGEIHDKVADL